MKKITGTHLINHKSQVQWTTELGLVILSTMNWGIHQDIVFGLNIYITVLSNTVGKLFKLRNGGNKVTFYPK